MIRVRNLDWIRNLKIAGHPEAGAKLFEALSDIVKAASNIESQTNSDGAGNPLPPPPIQGLQVSAQNGHFQIAIHDGGAIYRGIRYYVEHADNPQFRNAQRLCLQDARNHNLFLGNVTRYFRAYSAYSSTSPSNPVYFGGSVPQPVIGGGKVAGPNFLPDQGTGTGGTGGVTGPGQFPFVSADGVPPGRG
jgi:hypothetical protein